MPSLLGIILFCSQMHLQILLDKRERDLFKYTYETMMKLPEDRMKKLSIRQEDMPIGDIIFQIKKDDEEYKSILIIERKSFTDLLASIKDGRYEEQSHRLINTSQLQLHSIIYLLEGMFSQILEKDKKLIMSTMASLNIFKGFSVLRTSTIYETGELLITFADKIVRDMEKGRTPHYMTFSNTLVIAEGNPSNDDPPLPTSDQQNYCNFVKKVKKENITPENIGEIILSQIPGISSVTAVAIMKKFSTFPRFISELKDNPQCLDDIVTETNGKTRKISKSCIENIRRYFL